ncbi:zinc ribbon domain-containing protein [Halosegnis longus]|uniref:zinc ribbon domain-containing protein n=1 Tax=Halosegnis longus TaxID=2216012 RepID=UPI00096AB50C|nr:MULTISPECIES: zinc ribbon domain-containing protein [Halobacteriales]
MPRLSANDLRKLGVYDVDALAGEIDALRWYLTSGSTAEQNDVSEAMRKLAYAYPDRANELRSELNQLQRNAGNRRIRVNLRKAKSFIDERSTGVKDSIPDTHSNDGSPSGGTNVHTPSSNNDTEVYTDDAAGDTAVYTDTSSNTASGSAGFDTNFCPECGTDLSSLDGGSYCPECGNELPT